MEDSQKRREKLEQSCLTTWNLYNRSPVGLPGSIPEISLVLFLAANSISVTIVTVVLMVLFLRVPVRNFSVIV